MNTQTPVRFLPCGDTALAIEFGSEIDRSISDTVLALDAALAREQVEGIVEAVPTFRSLLVHFDPLKITHRILTDRIAALLRSAAGESPVQRRWHIPACYEGDFAPDLGEVAERTGLSPAEVIELHSATEFHVYMIGFLPGFPYMGDLPKPLRLPRREEPRTRLPAGSIAIATAMTAIYPVESPGGWHLIGRSPVKLFDVSWDQPALLAPGDKVRFVPLPASDYDDVRRSAESGDYVPECETVDP